MSKTMRTIQQFSTSLLNMQRSWIQQLDFVMLPVPSGFAPMPSERNLIQRQLFGAPPMSLLAFVEALDRIGADPRPLGVILSFSGVSASLADLQTMRDAILALREKGKRVLSFAPGYRTLDYFVASAGDEIWLLPGAALETTGIFSQQVFIRDGLAALGLQFDAVAISPYKGAADALTRSEPSPEGRAQTDWLLDSLYGSIIDGIASTRKMKPEAVQAMIDGGLYTSEQALEKGYIDAVYNEEQLPGALGIRRVTPWAVAKDQLYLARRDYMGKYVALLYAGGMIVDGESASPPADSPLPLPFVGRERLGDATLKRQVRNLLQDPDCAALVLYIDSGGGSASASESMASTLAGFARRRPLVVAMGAVAASGGYYIATPAHWIVAQPGTVTGSIGVLMGKLVNSDMLKKLRFNAFGYRRGEHANLVAGDSPFSDRQRALIQGNIEQIYRLFLQRVGSSRGKSDDELEAIAGGRVWTGEQALAHGLVDELGGLQRAIAKARELAQLPPTAPALVTRGKVKPIGVQVAQANPAAAAQYALEGLQRMSSRAQCIMPFEWTVK